MARSCSWMVPVDSVEQRDAVKQDAAREGAEDEVLERRLVRTHLALEVAGQDIARQGHRLQTDPDGQQRIAARHEHHAGRREEQQRVQLRSPVAPLFDEPVGQRDRQQGRQDHQHLPKEGEAVEDERAAENQRRLALQRRDLDPRHQPGRRDQADRGHDRGLDVAEAAAERAHQQEQQAGAGEKDLR